jgi:hypothetical protein
MQDVEKWKFDPETFIEQEDDNYLMLEYDMDPEMTLSLLSFQLVDKLIEKFYSTTYPFVQSQLLQQYFTGHLKLQTELQEDALLSMVCMLGKIQKDNKVPADQLLDVCFILDMIRQSKWDSLLFQRRYIHILIQWVKLIPKTKFTLYYNLVLDNLAATSDLVLIYEHASCIHEMLKEIEYWIKQRNSANKSTSFQGLGGSPIIQGQSLRRVQNASGSQGEFLNFGESLVEASDD